MIPLRVYLGMAGMGRNTTEMEQAVARTLRDSLEKLQRTTDEVNQAVGDLVSACASARPSNSLPHMLRAQTAAASLAASLDVLARFITSALQPQWSAQFAPPEVSHEAGEPARADFAEPAAAERLEAEALAPEPLAPERLDDEMPRAELAPEAFQTLDDFDPAVSAVEETLRTVASETEALDLDASLIPELPAKPLEQPSELPAFDVSSLSAEEQELHRRANRVAKVSMQDIRMLRPGDVRLGKENNDLCLRLRDDIERAHKEYDRRFHAILDHPVDYFYAWMVEILGDGDPQALGEYPYPSPVLRQ
jgi:hypothetical protein